MPIHLEFTLTFEEYLSAARLKSRQNAWARFSLLFQEFLAPILGITIGIFALLRAVNGERGILLAIMLCTAIYLVAFTNPRTRFKQAYKQTGANAEQSWEFDESRIRSQNSTSKSEFMWDAVRSFTETTSSSC